MPRRALICMAIAASGLTDTQIAMISFDVKVVARAQKCKDGLSLPALPARRM